MNTSSCIENPSISTVASEDRLSKISDTELSSSEQIAFQLDLLKLLERRACLYTSNESSSIPEQTAHELLLSILYTLKVDPDEPDAYEVRTILEEGIEQRFARNLKELEHQIEYCQKLLDQANRCTPFLGSRALEDTLQSIQKLATVYDYRFFAHEVPAEIDYPLALSVPETVGGITYLNEYLNRIIIEGTFLQHFDLNTSKHLLRIIHPEYKELLINLFEPIAINALGCVLAEKEVFDLSVTCDDIPRIEMHFKHATRKSSIAVLKSAAARLCSLLHITDSPTQSYLEKVAIHLYPRIKNAVAHNSLNGVFLSIS